MHMYIWVCDVHLFAVVLSPVITSFTASPLLLIVNDTGNLTCVAQGGPRLRLTIQRGGSTIVATGAMGDNSLMYNFIPSDDNFGQYTCNAIIDDRQINESVLVVGMYKYY